MPHSMDAISFVLGIKSSHLRSAHLKDLIYRGRVLKTSKINDDGSVDPSHQPNGDGQNDDKASRGDPKTAWVMAVYEDDAGEEQRWKRSITSQGASEYRINDRVVTAQQYNDGLEQENILIKARNFLVFQGDVEAIASQSPQDLTRLVEQISGSLEYKADYEKLQALAEEAVEVQNFQLHRRRGINSEIKQYREQKKEAENFQKKADEKDEAIVTQTLWKLYHFQKAMDQSRDVIASHQEELKDIRRNVELFEKKLDNARKDQSSTSRQVSHIERDIKTKERGIEDKENALIPFDEKISQTSKRVDHLNHQIEKVTKERDQQTSQVQKVQKDLEMVDKARDVFEKQVKEKMKEQGREITDEDRKEHTSLRTQVMARTSKNQADLEHLERSRKADEVTVNNLKGKVEALEAAIEKQTAELQSIGERKDTAQSVSEELNEEIAVKKQEFNRLQSERVHANQKRTELEEKLEDVARKLREADDGRRQNDKEVRLKEMVTALRRIFPGIHGRVGELCKPKQKKYEEAVLVALGRNFDSVVVDTEKIGSDCIAYLREQRFPTMSFIPLDNVKVPQVNTAIKNFSGARLTVDTINFETPVERAITYACGNSVVCDTLEIAKHICYDRKVQVEAVTLDGFVIHESGTMTGGRGPESKSKRRFEEADVQNLQRIAAKLTEDIERTPRADRRGTAEESLQTELAGLERRLATVKEELTALNKNHASKKRELDSLKRELKELRPKYQQQRSELERVTKKVQTFRDAIARVEDEVFASFCARLGYSDIRAYEASQGKFEQEVDEKRSEFLVQKQRLESRLRHEISTLQGTESRIKNAHTQLKSLNRDIKSFSQEKAEIEEQLAQERAEVEVLTETLDEYRSELSERTQKVAEAKAELQKHSKGIESRQKEINGLESEVQKNNSAKSALLRRCRLEQIQVPLAEGNLDNLPMEDNILRQDPDAMDVDEDEEEAMEVASVDDHGIEIDYSSLNDKLKEVCGDNSFSLMNLGLTVNSHRAQISRRSSQRRLRHSLWSWRSSTLTCGLSTGWRVLRPD